MRRRILAIDDVPLILEALGNVLSRWGYDVTLAATGAEAQRALAAEVPDLIILDLGLPDLSGEALLKIIRQRPELRMIPVIVNSVQDDAATTEPEVGVGPTVHTHKKITCADLASLVDEMLHLETAAHGGH
jgi:CheY-like chemotaxis protein